MSASRKKAQSCTCTCRDYCPNCLTENPGHQAWDTRDKRNTNLHGRGRRISEERSSLVEGKPGKVWKEERTFQAKRREEVAASEDHSWALFSCVAPGLGWCLMHRHSSSIWLFLSWIYEVCIQVFTVLYFQSLHMKLPQERMTCSAQEAGIEAAKDKQSMCREGHVVHYTAV